MTMLNMAHESSIKVEVYESDDQTGFNLLAFLINLTRNMVFLITVWVSLFCLGFLTLQERTGLLPYVYSLVLR